MMRKRGKRPRRRSDDSDVSLSDASAEYSLPETGGLPTLTPLPSLTLQSLHTPSPESVGRVVNSSQADDRKMIRLVKERNLLYARNNMPVASYYNQVKKLWQEIATEMGWSVAEVRRKWSHIRNSYSRHLRNEVQGARTGKGRVVSRWYLADELDFLRDHMATDVRTPSISAYPPTLVDMDIGDQSASMIEHHDVKQFINNPWFTLSGASLKSVEVKSEPHPYNDDSSSSQNFRPDENTSYFQFFRGIYNDFQELPVKKQRLFKRQCMQFLHDMLDDEDSQSATLYKPVEQQNNALNLCNTSSDVITVEVPKKVFVEPNEVTETLTP